MQGPIFTFTLLLLVILVVPPLFERLRLPGLVGLLIAGIVLGQSGLQWLDAKSETMQLLSGIGKVYLMFVAGLEIDLKQFHKTRNRSLGFGFLTFIVPMIMGTTVGRLFDFGWNASVLIGSLLASHTLLAYPIVSRLGVVSNEAVMVTIGATIITDTAALLVLAVCVGIHLGSFTALSFATLIVGLALYSVLVLVGFDWAGKEFFRRSGDAEGNQFLFILLALFLASVGAQVIGVEQIVGAFLAGLAVNDVLGNSPVKEKVEFVGSVLFIPCFFIDMGLLINLPAFLETLGAIWLTAAIVGGLISSKFIAALLSKWLYHYKFPELMTMWSLSLPQVAATLTATLVGYQTLNAAGERLIGEGVLNSVIVLMVVTSVLGPLITARFAPQLTIPTTALESLSAPWFTHTPLSDSKETNRPFTIVVPTYNPKTQQYLIEMAALLARHESGRIIPVAIVKAPVYMDHPQLESLLERNHKRLQATIAIGQEFNVETQAAIRIDDDVATGISRVSREHNANLIVMGWSRTTGFRARLFGNVIDSVICAAHCPVAVTRLLISPTAIQSILVLVNDFTSETLRTIRFAQILADANQATVVLFHVSNPQMSTAQSSEFSARLSAIAANRELKIRTTIETVHSSDIAGAVLQAAEDVDLVMLHTVRYRTAGGLAVSEVTTHIVQSLNCSLILLGEPQA
ncbi:cation:proton antiporter [Leptolyngbya sp. FACHB-261]|uniref:cation:proton antiporter domain-containing protein n=1 Tax=Leptolyngbya sp. FACHB-261 TaxID=2692806 RepID=UPI001688E1C4|nr:cation:proton antiporter [Leptolyngbya sp. FACHB-261]MBD2104281.1 cation:proton antiporter [Leptolyngbya sp. FACHB-261]